MQSPTSIEHTFLHGEKRYYTRNRHRSECVFRARIVL